MHCSRPKTRPPPPKPTLPPLPRPRPWPGPPQPTHPRPQPGPAPTPRPLPQPGGINLRVRIKQVCKTIQTLYGNSNLILEIERGCYGVANMDGGFTMVIGCSKEGTTTTLVARDAPQTQSEMNKLWRSGLKPCQTRMMSPPSMVASDQPHQPDSSTSQWTQPTWGSTAQVAPSVQVSGHRSQQPARGDQSGVGGQLQQDSVTRHRK